MVSNDTGTLNDFDDIKQALDVQSDTPLTDVECERLLTQWSRATGVKKQTSTNESVDKLFLRHFTLRIGSGGSTELSQLTLHQLFTLTKRHSSPTSRGEGDIETIVREASVSAAALKLLHSLLSLPRGTGGAGTHLELTSDEVQSTTEELLTISHYFPRNVSTGSISRSNLLATSETEITSTDAGSEVESSGTGIQSGRRAISSSARTVRQNAISCLSALHEAVPALMFSSWPRLLDVDLTTTATNTTGAFGAFGGGGTLSPRRSSSLLTVIRDDPVLSIRLAATQLVSNLFKKATQRGFLAAGIIEPRTTGVRSAFTSLSARIGSLIAGTRAFLTSLLVTDHLRRRPPQITTPPLPPALLEALLRCIKSLVDATRNVQLRKSHADILREPIMHLSAHTDPSVAISAFNLLSVVSPAAATVMTKTGDSPVNASPITPAISGLLHRLETTTDGEILAKLWSALCTFSQDDVTPHQRTLLSHLKRHLMYDDQGLRQACIAFLTASLNGEYTSQYLPMIKSAATDHSALVRTEVTQALAGVLLLEMKQGTTYDNLEMARVLETLICDPEAVTRAGALRALGVVLASGEVNEGRMDSLTKQAMRLLGINAQDAPLACLSLSDSALLVRLRASWTLGNLCQALCTGQSTLPDSQAQQLLSPLLLLLQDDERIAINALRSAGLLLSHSSSHILSASQPLVKSLLTVSHSSKSPKMKWNAVNAISTCLSSAVFRSTTAPWGPQISLTLSGHLSSKIFKVKLAASAGLMHICEREYLGSAVVKVKEEIDAAVLRIEGEIRETTFQEAQVHGKDTRAALDRVQMHFEKLLKGSA